MAEEPVTKWWAVGATDEVTVRKYVSFLYKHSLFGGHVGLPQEIRNEKPNRSLDSTRGMYDMLEVYSVPGKPPCLVGTVVNFMSDTGINPDGLTYVYPCEDISKPLGYMVVKASPDAYGICVVSGIVEVPLGYEKGSSIDVSEYKDYVEYDLENATFKFSDSGYPVFNVYQDVDGDWIAIILFGNTKSDWEYDGPFATSITGITGSTLYVDIAEGDFIHENIRHTFDDLNLMTDIALSSGESLWLNVYLDGTTCSYALQSLSNPPTQNLGNSLWYRIAEYDDGKVKQIQYGDIFNDIQHIKVEGVTGSTAYIHLTGYSSSTASENNLMFRGIGCSFSTLGQNDICIIVDGSTGGGGGGEVQSLYSSITGGTPSINITGNTSHVNIVGGTNANTRVGSNGEIIVDLDLNVDKFIYSGEFAISGVTSSGGYLYMNIEAGTVVVGNNRYPVPSETGFRISYGESLCLIGRYENGNPEFDYLSVDEPDEYSVGDDSFLVVIGRSVENGMEQIQYGEISTVPWGISGSTVGVTGITHTVDGGTAFISTIGGTGSVAFVGEGVDITGTINGEIKLGVSGSTGSGVAGYSILATGGTTSTRLQENTNYIVWVKTYDGDLQQATNAYLTTYYSSLTIHSGDSGDMVLELPLMGDSLDFSFIKVDNKLRAMDIVVIDTQDKGIVFGDPVSISGNTVGTDVIYYTDDYYYNSCCLDAFAYIFMYDPEGIYVEINGVANSRKAHWIIYPLED